jgi:hypothetical protein
VQTIVLSGRVGSGKTEALRHCLRFLACLEPSTAQPSGKKVGHVCCCCSFLALSVGHVCCRCSFLAFSVVAS